ncbi:hypothetical protein [Streptomyces sp. AD55]|uniref:hypothetical protein n=1 Tax=Streptomyces sp. AD55 TaxID=3242895 RepID=UPI0035271F98
MTPIATVLRHTLAGRPARAAAVLDDVVGDARFTLCCAAAEACRDALLTLRPGGAGRWALPAAAARAGAPELWAARFVTVYVNGQAGAAVDLYRAAERAGTAQLRESVCALLAHTYGLSRRAAAGPASERSGGIP